MSRETKESIEYFPKEIKGFERLETPDNKNLAKIAMCKLEEEIYFKHDYIGICFSGY